MQNLLQLTAFFLLEGKRTDELPEQILGGVRLSNVDHTKFPEAQKKNQKKLASDRMYQLSHCYC